jgi:hypothetical protein
MLAVLLLTAQVAPLLDEHAAAINGNVAQVSLLTAWGAASIAAGAGIAIAKREDKKWLTFGLFTAAVGAVNVGFGVAGLIQYENERRTLAGKGALEGEAIRDYQTALIARHRNEATVYAFNFGLDVCYVTTGALLWLFGERFLKNPIVHGMGMAGVIQGLALFAFDLTSWILAENRGSVVARMRLAF